MNPTSALALAQQLTLIAGGEPRTSLFELRFRRSTGGMDQAFVPVFKPERAAAIATRRGQSTDAYIGCAPRTRRSGQASAVDRVWCLWADVDGPEALEHLRAFRPLPSLVVRSGRDDGVHGWWRLSQPLEAAHVRRATLRLAHHLGGDRKVCEPARVLRAVGTLNFKYDPPRPVVCARLTGEAFTAREIVGALPDPPPPVPQRPLTSLPAAPGRIDGLVRAVREARPHEPGRNHTLFWAACRAAEHVAVGAVDEIEAREQLAAAALDAGLPPARIWPTLRSAFGTAHRRGTL